MPEETITEVVDQKAIDELNKRFVDAALERARLLLEVNAMSSRDVPIWIATARSQRQGSLRKVSQGVRERLRVNVERVNDLLEEADERASEVETIRDEGRLLGVEFPFDRRAREHGLSSTEQEMAWGFLAAYATSKPSLTKQEIARAVSSRHSEHLPTIYSFETGCLVESGLVEAGDEFRGSETYRATPLLIEAALPGTEVNGAGEVEPFADSATTEEACESYTEYLDLVASFAEARLRVSRRGRADVANPEEQSRAFVRRLRSRRRGRGLFADDFETGEDLETLERRIAAERASGRWNDTPIARLSAQHGLDEFDQRLLIFLALVSPCLEEEREESDDPRFGWRPEERSGVPGEDLLAILGLTRADRLAARDKLYASSPLRASGLVDTRGGREDSPRTMRFGVSESTIRAILGHDGATCEASTPRSGSSGATGFVCRSEPEITLDDVVLPEESRQAIESALESYRDTGATTFGLTTTALGQGRIAFALTGPPGTGKTQTAGGIAGELGLPLLEVDVTKLLSCWVGMTQKNIAKVFAQAANEEGGAVLVFDEADSLFFDRDGAHRSWEVQDVNVLLREIERFNGIVILATNRRDALDRALSRRMDVTLEFPKPAATEREAIWQMLLPGSPHLADDVDVADLARAADLTGGEIRKAVQEAVRRARYRGATRLDQTTLLEAVSFAKSGRWGDEARRPAGFGV